MGQQQLLLIVLGIIIVGIAIVIGINLFKANAVEAKRNNVTNELVNLAAMAQQYYMRPSALGGGNRTFNGWQIPSELRTTANGSFKIENIDAQEITLIGTGNEVVTGNDSVKVQLVVKPQTYETTILK
jgi:Tfp pilus assembly protein PilE